MCAGFAAAGYIRRRSTHEHLQLGTTSGNTACPTRNTFIYWRKTAPTRNASSAAARSVRLADLAWYIVGKSGSLLERSIIDRTVCAAERLVFEASPDLDPPLAQEKREATIHDGAPLDTKAACAGLSNSNR